MESLPANTCAFCDSQAPPTTDLVWPAWIREQFESTGTPALHLPMRDVCESCSSGWIGQLDQSVAPILEEPMLESRGRDWTTAEQRTLSIWAIKTAMVLELVRPGEAGRFFTDTERWLFMDMRDPPFNDIRIWAAARRDDPPVHYYGSRIKLLRPASGRQIGDVFVATISFGRVVFQMAARRLFEPRLSIDDVPFPSESSEWQGVTVLLWPASESSRRWPPRLTLDAAALETFGDRWTERFQVTETHNQDTK